MKNRFCGNNLVMSFVCDLYLLHSQQLNNYELEQRKMLMASLKHLQYLDNFVKCVIIIFFLLLPRPREVILLISQVRRILGSHVLSLVIYWSGRNPVHVNILCMLIMELVSVQVWFMAYVITLCLSHYILKHWPSASIGFMRRKWRTGKKRKCFLERFWFWQLFNLSQVAGAFSSLRGKDERKSRSFARPALRRIHSQIVFIASIPRAWIISGINMNTSRMDIYHTNWKFTDRWMWLATSRREHNEVII